MSATRASRTAPPDVLAYLARVLLAGRAGVLLIAHRDGLPAGVAAFAAASTSCGGCGRGDDDVWRLWEVAGQRVRLRVGHIGADPVIVTLRQVLAFALSRIGGDTWAELARQRDIQTAAIHELNGDRDRWFWRTFQSDRVSAAERAAIAAAQRRQFTAEESMRALVTECLRHTPDPLAGPDGQLALFASPDQPHTPGR